MVDHPGSLFYVGSNDGDKIMSSKEMVASWWLYAKLNVWSHGGRVCYKNVKCSRYKLQASHWKQRTSFKYSVFSENNEVHTSVCTSLLYLLADFSPSEGFHCLPAEVHSYCNSSHPHPHKPPPPFVSHVFPPERASRFQGFSLAVPPDRPGAVTQRRTAIHRVGFLMSRC